MKRFIIVALLLGMTSTIVVNADDEVENKKFKIAPIGRILIDGALYATPQKDEFKDGASIPDVRLGASMSYDKWAATVDIGYAYGKVGLKDIFIQYNFNECNSLRAGSFIHQYGLQSSTSSSMKVTMEEPISNAVFNDARQLGLMYKYSGKKFFATASAHVEPKATTVILRPGQFTQEGYGIRSRLVYHPFIEDGKILQAGISGGFATPQNVDDANTPHNSFQIAANFPTSVAQVSAVDATVDKAKNLWKFSPELLAAYGRVALESQYYFQQVNRRDDLKPFVGQGAYCILRGLILGENYKYDSGLAALQTPKKGSLEAVVGYNYVTLTDSRAGIYGGRANDVSFTLNYYINKYFMARLHYSYTHTWDREGVGSKSVNGFMARIQVIF